MSITPVGTPVSSYSGSVTKNVTIDSLVIFFATTSGTATPPFNTPTKTGTCSIGAITNVVNYTDGSNDNVGIWWMKVTASGSLTLAINSNAGADEGGSIHEYSGAETVTPLDTNNSGTGSDTTPEIALTGVDGESVIVFIVSEEDVTPRNGTATSPYTKQTEETDHYHATLDYVAPSGGNYTPQITISGTTNAWAVGAAAFLVAAAAAGQPAALRGAQVPGLRQWQPGGPFRR